MPFTRVSVYECECAQCGNCWTSRKPNVPVRCPECHSRKWNGPKERSVVQDMQDATLVPASVPCEELRGSSPFARPRNTAEPVREVVYDPEFSQES